MLSFSHLGYVGQTVEASALEGRSNVLSLEPKVISLQEVLIRLVEPKKLLREMIEHRDRNCSTSPVYLTTFYREGVQLKNKFQSLTEAVFKVYKSPTMEPGQKDQVKLLKMSKIDNREQTDSVLAKISSGVEACLQLDIMKNLPDFLLLESGEELYTYTSGDIVSVDDRTANVVYFEQKRGDKGTFVLRRTLYRLGEQRLATRSLRNSSPVCEGCHTAFRDTPGTENQADNGETCLYRLIQTLERYLLCPPHPWRPLLQDEEKTHALQ